MLFYLRRRLEREQLLLLKIFFYTCTVHLLLLLSFFLAEKYLRTTYTVLFAGRSTGPGAAVSFAQGTKSRQGSTGSTHYALPSALKSSNPSVQSALPARDVPKEKEKSLQDKLAEPKIMQSQEATKSQAAQETLKKVAEKQVPAKKEAKQIPAIPLYSELKREYSTLKTAQKSSSKKAFQAKVPELKKEHVSQRKKLEPESKKESTLQEKRPELEPKKIPKQPQEASVKHEAEIVPKSEQVQKPSNPLQNSIPGLTENRDISLHNGVTDMVSEGEILTIDFGDTLIADRFMREISQEIGRYFRKPPGFDDHEHFTLFFEICDQKARNVSARGSEPLVLYAALKEAILKATFSGIYTPTKVELVY